MRFTDRGVKALKPRDIRYEVFEDGRQDLVLRISPRGGKSWVFVYRRNGKLPPYHSGCLSGDECGRPRPPGQPSGHAQKGRRSRRKPHEP